MVRLEPLRAWHPDPSRFDPNDLVAPVYDTIGWEEHRQLEARPHNAAQFTSRRTDMAVGDFVQLATRKLTEAKRAGAYIRDEVPGLYVYSIEYRPEPDILETIPEEHRRDRYMLLGLVGALSMENLEEVALHERTFTDRVEERVELERATGIHNAPIMAGYQMADHQVNDLLERDLGLDRRNLSFEANRAPLVVASLHGSVHRLWSITEPATVEALQRKLQPTRILILDGHHRYTAARHLREQGHGVLPLTILVEADDRALLLLPWHRVLVSTQWGPEAIRSKLLEEFPRAQRLDPSPRADGSLTRLRELRDGKTQGFLMRSGVGTYIVTGPPLEHEGDNFQLLHRFLEETLRVDPASLSFVRSPAQATEEAQRSNGTAFLVPPLSMEGVAEEAFARRVMAQKSTMFLPKVAEGVLFSQLSDP